jgi:hypothetical protein
LIAIVVGVGEFVTASAFRTTDVDAVLAAGLGFFSAHSWPAGVPVSAEPVTDDDVLIYPPVDGWIVVIWSGYFTELAAVEFMSRRLDVLASTVRIHDGDYWSHALFRAGVTLDRFASMPDYFTDDSDEVARLQAKYAGQPVTVAQAIGCPVEQVAPYFVQVGLDADDVDDELGEADPQLGKAFADDEFELDCPWVFTDFWRRLGVNYPEDVSAYQARIRPASGWLKTVPTGDAEL